MLKIWGRNNSSNVQKVMWAVGELELPHQRIDAGGAFKGLDTAEYGRLNPNRVIPVIEDGELIVWESNTIVRYLAAKHGDGRLWPSDPGVRAQADMWMDWVTTTVVPGNLQTVFWQLVRTPEAERDGAAVEAAAQRLGPIWRRLDDWLGDRRYIGGAHLSIGDIPAGCAFYRYLNLPIDRPNLPNLQLWYQNLKGKPAFREHVMLPVT